MHDEAEYHFKELEQPILIARSDDRAETERELDSAEMNIAELKRIFEEESQKTS